MFIKRESKNMVLCGTTVDGCLFVCRRTEKWNQEQVEMLRIKYEQDTIKQGDELGLIGMHIQMNCKEKM